MKRNLTHESQLTAKSIRFDAQAIYHADGNINVYPCQYEQDNAPYTTSGPIRRKGKFTIEENGVGHFKAYRIGTGESRQVLFRTTSGELTATNKHLFVRLKFAQDLSTCRMLEALAQQMGEICDYIKNNL